MDAYLVEIESSEENTWIYQQVNSIPGKTSMETKITHLHLFVCLFFS